MAPANGPVFLTRHAVHVISKIKGPALDEPHSVWGLGPMGPLIIGVVVALHWFCPGTKFVGILGDYARTGLRRIAVARSCLQIWFRLDALIPAVIKRVWMDQSIVGGTK